MSHYEYRNPHLRSVRNLRITELRRVAQSASQWQSQLQSVQLMETELLPSRGKVGDFVSDKSLLFFQFDSQEIQVRVFLSLNEGSNQVETELDVILDKQMAIKDLRLVLQKIACRIWNQSCLLFEQQTSHRSVSLLSQIPQDRSLSREDIETAQTIYILRGLSTKFGGQAAAIGACVVADVVGHQDASVEVRCEFETLFNCFERQIASEAQMIAEMEAQLRRSSGMSQG